MRSARGGSDSRERSVIGRRSLLLGVATLAACNKKKEDAPPITTPLGTVLDEAVIRAPDAGAIPRGAVRLLKWQFDTTAMGTRSYAVIVVPAWGAPDEKFPVVIALHGHGESLKSPEEGAMGWPRDYALTRAVGRLASPPLVRQDYEGFVDDARLAEINRTLAARPYRGAIVACPYMPDGEVRDIAPTIGPTLAARAKFLFEQLLPRVRAETPALSSAAATGIDGVSFGGALALRIGLAHPTELGAVGALQPAIASEEANEFVQSARNARMKNAALALRLLTSDGDYFRGAVEATTAALRSAGIQHDYLACQGPHDYAFNRGPGSIEMLAWHERVLARA